MRNAFRSLYANARLLATEESGQDLVEYALVVAMIGFAAIAGMNIVANQINLAFSQIGSKVSQYST